MYEILESLYIPFVWKFKAEEFRHADSAERAAPGEAALSCLQPIVLRDLQRRRSAVTQESLPDTNDKRPLLWGHATIFWVLGEIYLKEFLLYLNDGDIEKTCEVHLKTIKLY